MIRRIVFIGLAIAFWLLFIPFATSTFVPGEIFIKPRAVVVESGPIGSELNVTPDYTVRFPVNAQWVSDIRRDTGRGYEPFCIRPEPEVRRYRRDFQHRTGIGMNVFLHVPPNQPCDWQPGRYLMYTHWRIPLLPPLIVLTTSEVVSEFIVTRSTPSGCFGVRGNTRTMVYHTPDSPQYRQVSPDNTACFPSPREAEAAGFRRPRQ